MTEEDKYALKEFLRGAAVFGGACVVFAVIMIVLANLATGGKPLEATFEVNYQGSISDKSHLQGYPRSIEYNIPVGHQTEEVRTHHSYFPSSRPSS